MGNGVITAIIPLSLNIARRYSHCLYQTVNVNYKKIDQDFINSVISALLFHNIDIIKLFIWVYLRIQSEETQVLFLLTLIMCNMFWEVFLMYDIHRNMFWKNLESGIDWHKWAGHFFSFRSNRFSSDFSTHQRTSITLLK